MLDFDICNEARLRRDPAFDGVFFIGVKTTGIYCRPVCPARSPLTRNISFYPSAAAAEAAGFRPCLRCRPETAPFSPAWNGTRTTVERALRLIADGALDDGTVEALAGRLGVGPRHLARLFRQHVGASPVQVAKTARVQRAKRLIDGGALTMAEIARAAGFGSLRRFNTVFLELYGRPPSAVRRTAPTRPKDPARQVAHV
jgi:AraC family transcriptional regulator of adaptative response/methylated-DNA-[protein]-cysteine methyltransferase